MIQALALLIEGFVFERLFRRYRWLYTAIKWLTLSLLGFLIAWTLYFSY